MLPDFDEGLNISFFYYLLNFSILMLFTVYSRGPCMLHLFVIKSVCLSIHSFMRDDCNNISMEFVRFKAVLRL